MCRGGSTFNAVPPYYFFHPPLLCFRKKKFVISSRILFLFTGLFSVTSISYGGSSVLRKEKCASQKLFS
jgi:hypothetical protein